MRTLRTGTSQPEEWDETNIMSYLGCDKVKAREIMQECRKKNNIRGYGEVEKHLILDFINCKQREEREREARYNADIATVRQVTALEEKVKALKELLKVENEQVIALREQDASLREMCKSSSLDAQKARTQSLIANIISFISLAIAVVALVLK